MTSVSLDPPLLLVCFADASLTLAAIRSHGAFAVNVLGEHHAVSRRRSRAAARRTPGARSTTPRPAGVPRLREALASLECTVEQLLPGGDHVIVLGRVLAVGLGAGPRAAALLPRRYASLRVA